jgi:NADH:ubiquinone oxidoreductase subunit E
MVIYKNYTEMHGQQHIKVCSVTLCYSLTNHFMIDHHFENFQTYIDINIMQG